MTLKRQQIIKTKGSTNSVMCVFPLSHRQGFVWGWLNWFVRWCAKLICVAAPKCDLSSSEATSPAYTHCSAGPPIMGWPGCCKYGILYVLLYTVQILCAILCTSVIKFCWQNLSSVVSQWWDEPNANIVVSQLYPVTTSQNIFVARSKCCAVTTILRIEYICSS